MSIGEKIQEIRLNMAKGYLVGVDIGLSAVKIAVMAEGKKGSYRLEAYESFPLSEASIIEDEVQKPEEIINAIQTILKKNGIKRKIACLGMDGPNTVTKRLQVPDGDKEEVEDNIFWESEQYIPFGADDAQIGFSIIGRNEDEDVVDAIVGAVKIDVAEKYMEYLKEAGLHTRVVDLNIFAVNNVFELCFHDQLEDISEEGAIIIDLGAQYTSLMVYRGGGPILTKEINLGGVLITEEIQRSMGVSYEEAEDLKVNGDDNGNLPEEIISILEAHINRLVEELKKVLNFYIAAGSSEQVSHCFITGGGAQIPGIKDALQDLTDIEVEDINPLEILEIKGSFSESELEELAYRGAVAVGLAMRRVD
ncbi:MAG: hypothetical protein CME65_09450 [Halobacteriovoraceae bacterium]|nr:hypothetical protein [Halobacteriovoraceae bacterium]